jgi:hypothetical protein
MFEHHKEPLIPRAAFFVRLILHICFALGIVFVSLAIGIVGYHEFEGLSWVDATVNAAMILGGMGPINELHSNAGKLFAAAYALFSGIVFLIAVAVIFAPVIHRFFHRFHLEIDSENSSKDETG